MYGLKLEHPQAQPNFMRSYKENVYALKAACDSLARTTVSGFKLNRQWMLIKCGPIMKETLPYNVSVQPLAI